MPTPRASAAFLPSPPPEQDLVSQSHLSCPPEQVRLYTPRTNGSSDSVHSEIVTDYTVASPAQQPSPPTDDETSTHESTSETVSDAKEEIIEDGPLRDTPTPASTLDDASECDSRALQLSSPSTSSAPAFTPSLYAGQISSPFPRRRFLPKSTSSFLRHGSRFHGTQKSDRQVYDVNVEIKHVDMEESFLCGYLRIQGLTDDHPTLTTYFEGEMIGTKYTFKTKHAEWGSNENVDMQHWARFDAWRPLAKQAKRSDFNFKNFAQREHIFMRWKEYFLVPDHRVRTISGASFEGFYYICFNQVTGTIEGIYYHAKSERYQKLNLKHVPDFGCMGAVEFR